MKKSSTDRKKSADTQGVCGYHHGSLKLLHGRRPLHTEKIHNREEKSIYT